MFKKILYAVLIVSAFVFSVWAVKTVKESVEQKRWLALGPIENHPKRVYDVKFAREFNDMNDVQLAAAQVLGVPPVKDRDAAEHSKKKLVKLEDTDSYVVDSLTHSIPYLVPSAKELLDRIGQNFLDSLSSKGLNPNKLVITSVLRTEDDVAKLRKRNLNASENSTHRYGTTFDISYIRFSTVSPPGEPQRRAVSDDTLKYVLSEVLRDLREQGRCYIKYEVKQSCFHITLR